MKYEIVKNIPYNPKEIYDYALSKSYDWIIDEKNTKDNPTFSRKISKLGYEDAFELILSNKPHWTISFRNNSEFGDKDYFEFGGCNISSNSYGCVFIWILVDIDVAREIFQKFNLKTKKY